MDGAALCVVIHPTQDETQAGEAEAASTQPSHIGTDSHVSFWFFTDPEFFPETERRSTSSELDFRFPWAGRGDCPQGGAAANELPKCQRILPGGHLSFLATALTVSSSLAAVRRNKPKRVRFIDFSIVKLKLL